MLGAGNTTVTRGAPSGSPWSSHGLRDKGLATWAKGAANERSAGERGLFGGQVPGNWTVIGGGAGVLKGSMMR